MRKKSAFTLVELMVAMAIISVLLGLAVFGVSAAQRGSRNTERKAALQDINLAIQIYVDKYSNIPTNIYFDSGSSAAYVGGQNANCASDPNNTTCVKVPLKGPSKPYTSFPNEAPGDSPTSDASEYKYTTNCSGGSGGYYLGVCTEGNSKPFEVGTCVDSSITMSCKP